MGGRAGPAVRDDRHALSLGAGSPSSASLDIYRRAVDHELNRAPATYASAGYYFLLVIPGRPASWLPVAGWAAVIVCAVLGWRRPAAGLAWLTAGWEMFDFIQAYRDLPVLGVDVAWKVVLAVVAASALTIAGTGALALIGWRRMLAIGAVLAASWLALGITLATLTSSIRRRLVAFAGPVAVPVLVDKLGLSGWRVSTGNMGHAVPLVPAQWLALFGLPVLVGLAGLAFVQRREHVLRMVQLGRSADLAES